MKKTSLLGGKVYEQNFDGFNITWESDGEYRHWCRMKKVCTNYQKEILIVMFNPGSLSSDGKRLSTDTTLRILREVFEDIPVNLLILNLFDFATSKPIELYSNWDKRNKEGSSIFDIIDLKNVSTYLWAYGDIINYNNTEYGQIISSRISKIKKILDGKIEIEIKKSNDGNNYHPYRWQFNNNKIEIREMIILQLKNAKII